MCPRNSGRLCNCCCFSSLRDFQPRPDLVSVVESLQEIKSKKLLSSQPQRPLLKVSLSTIHLVSHLVSLMVYTQNQSV